MSSKFLVTKTQRNYRINGKLFSTEGNFKELYWKMKTTLRLVDVFTKSFWFIFQKYLSLFYIIIELMQIISFQFSSRFLS